MESTESPRKAFTKREARGRSRGLQAAGHVLIDAREHHCQFRDEFFRIFVGLLVLDQRELEENRIAERIRREMERAGGNAEKAQRRLREKYGVEKTGDAMIDHTVELLSVSDFDPDWTLEDHSGLTDV